MYKNFKPYLKSEIIKTKNSGLYKKERIITSPQNSSINTNAWTHLAATFDDNTGLMKFYIDGVYAGSTTNSNFIQLPYIYVLSIKIVLCLWIFLIARWSRKSKNLTTSLDDNKSNKLNKFISSYNMVIILGLIVFLISDLLKIIVETTLLNN